LIVSPKQWRTHNESGNKRVIVTKELPGDRWLNILTAAECKVDICTSPDVLSSEEIIAAIGDRCDGAIGQLTEPWGEDLYAALKAGGGTAYSNYAVGFNNVDVDAATRHGIPVGNTPGVLTETTAQMAVALTFAAARRVGEAERFLRDGRYKGWLPSLFMGNLLWRKTVGVIGAGRIGAAYALMMVEGHKMNLVYYDPY
jgi:hydroxypyruvate reductase 1